MATIPLVCTIGSSGANGIPLSPYVAGAAAQGSLPATTDVTADIAVLVADGIAPTQAHVTTLDGHWTTYLAGLASFSGSVISGNVVLQFDTSVVTTKRKLRAAVAQLMQAVDSGYGGLPD